MAAYCLPKKQAAAFLKALKDGTIKPADLLGMKSATRRKLFEDVIGKENASEINSLFEGATVTTEEASNIAKGAKVVDDLKAAGWDETTQQWSSEAARLQYGTAYTKYQDYVGALLKEANTPTLKEWLKDPKAVALTLANTSKGIVAALDNSFFGRQGVKVLFTHPDIWTNAFVKSWGDIAKALVGGDPLSVIKADVFSRPNAMNGKYRNGKFAIGINFEEAFPTHLPEKIPLFGRLYKASEQAYAGAALRMRADLADRIIPRAEQFGVDMSTPGKQAEGIGHLVNAMTGRGNIGALSGEAVNAAFFSIRFLKSNFDTLTGHSGGLGIVAGPARSFVQREAATNLLKIAGGMAAVLFTAEQLHPGSVDADPRSANFGKIKIGDTRFDISGGMSSMVTLASRLVPTMHDGRWGFWSKSSTTGAWTDLTAGKFGQQNALEVLEQFWEGKLSPVFGALRDVWKGKTFSGQPVTPTGVLTSLVAPMSVQTFTEAMNDPKAAPMLAVVIVDTLGFGANTYSGRNYTVWGRPVSEAQDPDDPEMEAMHHLGLEPRYAPKNVRGVKLTTEQYDDFQQLYGQYQKGAIKRIIEGPGFETLPTGRQEDMIKKAIEKDETHAVIDLMAEYPELAGQINAARASRKDEGSPAAIANRARAQ